MLWFFIVAVPYGCLLWLLVHVIHLVGLIVIVIIVIVIVVVIVIVIVVIVFVVVFSALHEFFSTSGTSSHRLTRE